MTSAVGRLGDFEISLLMGLRCPQNGTNFSRIYSPPAALETLRARKNSGVDFTVLEISHPATPHGTTGSC
jgi:hypothetical protein